MLKLRDYQLEAKSLIRESFSKGKRRVILCMPTGSGKTVTFVDMVADTISSGKRVMIICDRKELIGQALNKMNQLGLSPTVIAPKYKQYPNNVYLASVDTLRRRELPVVDLIIIDEAHKQTFDKIVIKYIELMNPYIIGATATPLRKGKQNCLSTMYEDIVEPVTTSNLIDRGFLVTARTFASKRDFSDVKKKGYEYDNKALYEKFNQSKLYDGVVENYLKFSPGKKAICFNVNVEHSLQMVQRFKDSGIAAVHLDGKTPDALRRRILKDFSSNNFILSNCSVLTTGFDEPSIETVIVNRATMSLPLYLQMTGRGSRLFTNKENFTIMDQGANVYRHGLWQDEREWDIIKKSSRSDGVAPIKCCENCEAINHASARKCSECGTPFEIKKKELKKGEFIEVNPRRGMRKKPDFKTCTRQELADYAKLMGYKPGWVFQQLKLAGRIN